MNGLVYTFILEVVALFSLGLALIGWKRRHVAGAIPFTIVMVALGLWAFGYAQEFAASSLAGKVFWAKFQYLGIVVIPVAWLMFALAYTGYNFRVPRYTWALLTLVPLAVLLLVWTNESHRLIWRSVSLHPEDVPSHLHVVHGAAFWLHTAYSYVLLLIGTWLLIVNLARAPAPYRFQSGLIILAALLPMSLNLLYLLSPPFMPEFDLTPFAFAVTGAKFAWALFPERLFQVAPLARDLVFAEISDGVIVLDLNGLIVDMNQAAERILGHTYAESIAHPLREIWPHQRVTTLLRHHQPVEFTLREGNQQRVYEVRITEIQRGRPAQRIGYLLLFHDVTSHKQVQEELERRVQQLRWIARLQELAARGGTMEDIYEAALDGLEEVLHVEKSAILLMDKQGQMRFVAWRGISEAYRRAVEGHTPWPPRARNPRPVLVSNVATDDRLTAVRQAVLDEGIHSLAFIPLVIDGTLRGKLMLYYTTPHAFCEEEIRLARIIARHVASAIEHRQAQQILRERAAYLEALNNLMAETVRATDLPTLLEATLAHTLSALHLSTGAIWVHDIWRVQGVAPRDVELVRRVIKQARRATSAPEALAPAGVVGQPASCAELEDVFYKLGARACISVPILANGKRIGGLSVASRAPLRWSTEAQTFLKAVGQQVGETVIRLRLLQETQARAHHATLLLSLAESLNRPHAIPDVLQAIGNAMLHLTNAQRGAIFVREVGDGNGFRCLWRRGISQRHVDQVAAHIEELPARAHLVGTDPLLIEDTRAWPEDSLFRQLAEREGFRAMAAWPLIYEGKTIAAMVCYYDEPHTWDKVERETMTMFARQAAIALRNAQLLTDLERTNAQLAEALEARDAMLRNVSHELRTPLTLVRGYAELLADNTLRDDTEITAAANAILRNARHLEHLIAQLLTFQRIRREVEHKELVDVRAWLQEVVASWQQPVEEQGLHLVFEVEGNVGQIWGHPDFLNQVMYNLLDNACKFSPDGGTIRVRCWADEKEVHVAVSDQGIGIPPDKIDHIFDRFYQVDTSTKRRFGGMGLGLALVKEIVEQHGGRVWARSDGIGKGATVGFSLPRVSPEPNA